MTLRATEHATFGIEPPGEGADPVYDPGRHRTLDAGDWSPERVRDEIVDIVLDFEAAQQPEGSWPTHPFESLNRAPRWCQFDGAAGAVVALRLLRAAGYPAKDPTSLLHRIHAEYLRKPDEGYATGLQLGETGILAPAALAGDLDAAGVDRLLACMRRTIGHPARETTSGETGVMHAALTLFRETRDERWAAVYRDAAHSLFQAWARHAETGTWLWRSDIFGSVRHYYGACHGVSGNAAALLRGMDLLPGAWLETVLERTVDALARGGIRCGDDLNWPVSCDPSGTRRLVQWCHGATGVVAALADSPRTPSEPSRQLDRLLDQAGALVWKVGPVKKGPGICHGTAGSGYAFLGLYRRTGESRWLDRARRFAMHAIGQRRRGRSRHGQGKYTLWTGDGGLAVYLHHCLLQESGPRPTPFPGLEAF